MQLFIPPTLAVPSSMPSCWRRKPDFRHIPLQKRRNGALPELRLSILAGSWPVRSRAMQLALEFYGPMYLLYSVYDGAEKKESASSLLATHIDRFIAKVESDYRKKGKTT